MGREFVGVLVVLVAACGGGEDTTQFSNEISVESAEPGSGGDGVAGDRLGLSPSSYELTDCSLLNFDCPYDIIPCDVPERWELVDLVNARYWSVQTEGVVTAAEALEESKIGMLALTFEGVPSSGMGDEFCDGTSLVTCTVKSRLPGEPTLLEGICRSDFSGSCRVGSAPPEDRTPMSCSTLSRVEFAIQ